MSRVTGDKNEVLKLSRDIEDTLKDMVMLNKWAAANLNQLKSYIKDASYDSAEAMVGTVANQILKSVQACKETTVKLNEYGRFLGELEDEG